MYKSRLVTSSRELSEMCERLSNEAVIAVDTEFFWERTFYPVLGLVQIATADRECFLVDTVVLDDIIMLGPILENGKTVKILHDAPQDLGILARETQSQPCNIFDTRTSAGFAGFDSTLSLQNLLKQCLGIDLTKSETRSNWIKRPLTEAQLDYALYDVLYLPELREYIIGQCRNSIVLKWMKEENESLSNPETFEEREPRKMFLRVKGASRLNKRQLAVLRELAAWRENKARRRNLPRGRVLSNSVIIGLAFNVPDSITGMQSVPDFPRKMPDGVIKELIKTVKTGLACPDAECPEAIDKTADRKKLKQETKKLHNFIIEQSEKHGIDPALVASRADMETYISNCLNGHKSASGKLDTGWRSEIISGILSGAYC
ncbi:MAG: HRDC domain-containing protein [Kiritimatiellia bacterium]